MAIEKSSNVPPFVSYCATLIPTVFDNSLSYYEALSALAKWMQDNLVNVINNNAEVTEKYVALTEALKSYVENYFENLDVQDEINTKLDEMTADGTLEEIIGHYISENYVTKDDIASADAVGVVKVGETLSIDANGVLNEKAFENYIPAEFKAVRYQGTGGYSTIHYALIDKQYKPNLALANDALNTDEWAGDNASRHKSTLTVNAGLWNTTTHVIIGPVIIDGEILKENTESPNSREIIYMSEDGTLNSVSDTSTAQQVLDLGAVWAVEGWYPFIKNGVDLTSGRDPSDYQPRTIIGQDAEGNYLVFVANGRSYQDVGVSAVDCVNFCTSIGFTPVFLYNLDGGGSIAFVEHGIRMNNLVQGEHRKSSNFIYWASPTAKDNGTFEAVNGQYHKGAENMRESIPYNVRSKIDVSNSSDTSIELGSRVYVFGELVVVNVCFTNTAEIASWRKVLTGLPKCAVTDIQVTAHQRASGNAKRDLYITNEGNLHVSGHNTLPAGTWYVNFVYSKDAGKELSGNVE